MTATAQLTNTGTVNQFQTTLDGSVTINANTITLNSVTGLATSGILLIDGNRGSTYREFISYTGISSKTLTGVARGLGEETAKVHNDKAEVKETLTIDHWNNLIASLEIGHNSVGTHKKFLILHTINTYTPNAGATATLNLSNGNVHFITMPAGNITIAVSNTTVGDYFVVRILQDGVGSRTVTWFSTISWDGGNTPILTTDADKVDVFGFRVTGTNTYQGFVIGQNV
jgi:hypothetical protein